MAGPRVVLASVRRPWGRRGEVLLDVSTDWPEQRFAPGTELVLAWVDGRERRCRVADFQLTQSGPLLALEGVGDIGAARALAGASVVAEAAALVRLAGGDEWLHADFPGMAAVDRVGTRLGTVTGIEEAPGTDLLRIELTGGGEALVPLAPAICVAIDGAARQVVLDPPEGLLDLRRAVAAGRSEAAR